jgi:hypothetical protein
MPPIPRVAAIPTFLSPPGSVPLDATTSTVGSNVTYIWSVVESPPGTSPSIIGGNIPTPQLVGTTQRGTYIVFLKIIDSTGASHPVPYPTQSELAPYGFTAPLASAFAVVRVAEESGLVKPGRGEYGWLERLWDVIDKVGEIAEGGGGGGSGPPYDDATGLITVAGVVPDVMDGDKAVNFNGLDIVDNTDGAGAGVAWASITASEESSLSRVTLSVPGTSAGDGLLRITPNAGLTLQSGSGPLLVETTAVEMSADSGDVFLTAAQNVSISSTGSNTEVTLSATGSGSSAVITAASAVTITAALSTVEVGESVSINSADNVTIHTGANSGAVNLHATGSNSQLVLTSAGTLSLSSAARLSLTCTESYDAGGVAITTEAASSNIVIQTEGSDSDLIISSSDEIAMTSVDDITISTTGISGDINISTSGLGSDISISAKDSVSLTSDVGGIVATSGDNLDLISGAALRFKSEESTIVDVKDSLIFWVREAGGTTPPSTSPEVSTLVASRSKIELRPGISTYSDKPIFAPGIPRYATEVFQSDAIILNGEELKILDTDSPATYFTKHVAGSVIKMDFNVLGAATSTTHPRLVLVCFSDGVEAFTVFDIQTPHVNGNAEFFFRASITVSCVALDKVLCAYNVDTSNITAATIESYNSATLQSADVTSSLSFRLILQNGVSGYALSAVSSLINPHAESVL